MIPGRALARGRAAELDFHRAMVQIYETARRDVDYKPTRFLQMVSEHGGVEAARHLLRADTPSEGFITLWAAGRLDLTVEAHVLKPEYADLFTEEERRIARRRLDEYQRSS